MKRISLFLSRSQIEGLKTLSDQQGLSMAELVRRALDHFFEAIHSKRAMQAKAHAGVVADTGAANKP